MEIVLNTATIIAIAGVISALGVILGLMWKIFKEYKKVIDYDSRINELDKKIDDNNTETIARTQSIMAELVLHTKLFDAVLDGLEQLGCNHSVPQAREEIEAYRPVETVKKELQSFLNERAHEVNAL